MHPAGHLVRRKSHNGGLYRVSRTQSFIVILHRNLAFFQTLCGAVPEYIGRRIEAVITGLTRNQLNSKEFRGFESHRLRQEQHPAGCCFLFLRQTMQGLQGGIRTARARRFASRRAATVLRTVARARENPTVCAKYHYSILHWVVIFCCRFVKIPYFSYKHLPFIFK